MSRLTTWTGRAIVLALAAFGACTLARMGYEQCRDLLARRHAPPPIPLGKLPGPPRETGTPRFALTEEDSQSMTGIDDFPNARWYDLDDNLYSRRLINEFRYEDTGPDRPQVRVRIEPAGATLSGRLEARRLKPNFAYQIKLRGIYEDRHSYEAIGFAGRWRLPGPGTNYSDDDYRRYPDKSRVEAFILFDYLITDRDGNAVRDFALDSSLHVLWRDDQRPGDVPREIMSAVTVDATSAEDYLRPRPRPTVQWIWAERESQRYRTADQTIFLAPGDYRAEIVLTEESFHTQAIGGGYWATVFRCPVTFRIVPADAAPVGSRSSER